MHEKIRWIVLLVFWCFRSCLMRQRHLIHHPHMPQLKLFSFLQINLCIFLINSPEKSRHRKSNKRNKLIHFAKILGLSRFAFRGIWHLIYYWVHMCQKEILSIFPKSISLFYFFDPQIVNIKWIKLKNAKNLLCRKMKFLIIY